MVHRRHSARAGWAVALLLFALSGAAAQPLDVFQPLLLAVTGTTLVQTGTPPVRQAPGVRTPAYPAFAWDSYLRPSVFFAHLPPLAGFWRTLLTQLACLRAEPPAAGAAGAAERALRSLRRSWKRVWVRGGCRPRCGISLHARGGRAGGSSVRAAAARRQPHGHCSKLRGAHTRRQLCGGRLERRGGQRGRRGHTRLHVLWPVCAL